MALKLLLSLGTNLTLAGCAVPSPKMSAQLVQQSIGTACSKDLARAYGAFRSPAVRDELVRRGVFDPDTWTLIDDRRVVPQMSAEAVLAAWGAPDGVDLNGRNQDRSDIWIYERANSVTGTRVMFSRRGLVDSVGS